MQGAVHGISDLGVTWCPRANYGISCQTRAKSDFAQWSLSQLFMKSWGNPLFLFHTRVSSGEPSSASRSLCAFVLLAHSEPCCPVFIWWFLEILPFWLGRAGCWPVTIPTVAWAAPTHIAHCFQRGQWHPESPPFLLVCGLLSWHLWMLIKMQSICNDWWVHLLTLKFSIPDSWEMISPWAGHRLMS